MNDFKSGQRWICDVDLQLGLGTVQSVEERIVSITFMATEETRTYARQSAPLTRVIFNVGDTITNRDGVAIQILSIQEEDGLLIYSGYNEHGNRLTFPEHQLAHHLQFNRPIERLLNQHIDADKWFRIRYQTWLHRGKLANAPLYGLLGARTSLIPHQLYIAHEVGRRYAPRVLLADEVGLGKTIEAGMILHQQLLTERAKRILIVVPETLIHQWLVEMLRRFNLHFSIFDEERYSAIEESNTGENPFHSEQLILCSLKFLCNNPQHFQTALKGDWDLLVVDEAHHLEWSEQSSSPAYQVIEQLAAQTRGVLLLTATPEQLGKAGHFARLRLLDPDRFADFHRFVAEEQAYEPIANAVEALFGEQQLNEATRKTILSIENSTQTKSLLASLEETDTDTEQNKQPRQILAASLLDRHGTGRLLFRNTRAAVEGFPERKLFVTPLPLPDDYDECLTALETDLLSEPQLLLYPELLYQASAVAEYPAWTEIDPRVSWLYKTMRELKPEKILVITARAQTARDIAQALKTLTSQHFPVFHEHMSLLERDRAAAFFADREAGCQVLICSEIGSEGRNFQFAHHLVLFDLPINPDMLEQRIGRLDRIGQTETINIHIPYLQKSAQAIMLRWYQEGLNALEKICPAGQTVYQHFKKQLMAALHLRAPDSNDFSELIKHTQKTNRTLSEALDFGRDRLLEYNSFRPQIAEQLYQAALLQDTDNSLQYYMDAAFDCFGVHVEEHRSESYRIEPSEHMTSAFPGLYDEGMIITYKRSTALANEDWQFLTWEHPMVIHAIDRVIGNETGNATVSSFSHRDAQPGILFLECLFVLEISATSTTIGSHILPSTMIRTIIDEENRSDYPALDHATINQCMKTISQDIAKRVIELKKEIIQEMIAASEQLAYTQIPTLSEQTRNRAHAMFTTEIERLVALQKVNPNVRPEEIRFLEQQLSNFMQALDTARIRLDAIRVIVAT
ncbi:MAG TPA: RNA polymerase-associated protein RapA [Nitrosomonas sp.]|nr:RNA polymerase-associated protein RapA [Nitrosomonas sp.]